MVAHSPVERDSVLGMTLSDIFAGIGLAPRPIFRVLEGPDIFL